MPLVGSQIVGVFANIYERLTGKTIKLKIVQRGRLRIKL